MRQKWNATVLCVQQFAPVLPLLQACWSQQKDLEGHSGRDGEDNVRVAAPCSTVEVTDALRDPKLEVWIAHLTSIGSMSVALGSWAQAVNTMSTSSKNIDQIIVASVS